jgi:hypothetical protein
MSAGHERVVFTGLRVGQKQAQRNLSVDRTSDPLELEADRIADHVIAAPPRSCSIPGAIQRYSGQAARIDGAAPASVDHTLAESGRPLDRVLQEDMGRRFGYDFSRVRVHSGQVAERSARDVSAHAYTVGKDIVFGAGQFVPHTASGRRLLAHELTHVIQQSATASTLQREPDKAVSGTKPAAAERKDVVLLMADGLEAEAATLAPGATPIRVSSVKEMATALKGVKQPIGRLFIIAHSLSTGDLGFETAKEVKFVMPEAIAKALTGTVSPANAPEVIDFRGCSVGSDPSGMNAIRTAVGAKSAIGGNCFMIVQTNGPVLINGTKIVNVSQVTNSNRTSFESGLRALIDKFGKAKNCVLDASEKSYFRAGGKLVAAWMSPELDTNWDDRKSRCYKDLVPERAELSTDKDFTPGLAGNCRLIRVGKQGGD